MLHFLILFRCKSNSFFHFTAPNALTKEKFIPSSPLPYCKPIYTYSCTSPSYRGESWDGSPSSLPFKKAWPKARGFLHQLTISASHKTNRSINRVNPTSSTFWSEKSAIIPTKKKRKRYNSTLTRWKPRAASGDSQLTPSTDSQLVKDSYP